VNAWWRQRLAPLWNFHGTPHELAFAFGLGVAIGILPGTGALAAAACAAILRLNAPIMVAGSLLVNPFTTPFVYLGSYAVGRWLLGAHPFTWLAVNVVAQILVGGLLLAIALGVISYLVVFGVVLLVRARRRPVK